MLKYWISFQKIQVRRVLPRSSISVSSVLKTIGDAVPAGIELGYHLCYGSPADEHCVQPKDAGIMVEMTNAIAAGVKRPIQFFHLPVPKGRSDDGYYVP